MRSKLCTWLWPASNTRTAFWSSCSCSATSDSDSRSSRSRHCTLSCSASEGFAWKKLHLLAFQSKNLKASSWSSLIKAYMFPNLRVLNISLRHTSSSQIASSHSPFWFVWLGTFMSEPRSHTPHLLFWLPTPPQPQPTPPHRNPHPTATPTPPHPATPTPSPCVFRPAHGRLRRPPAAAPSAAAAAAAAAAPGPRAPPPAAPPGLAARPRSPRRPWRMEPEAPAMLQASPNNTRPKTRSSSFATDPICVGFLFCLL